MTESLIKENETHLYGPRGAKKRHSKLVCGPICCYFINQPASVGVGEGSCDPSLLKIPFVGPLRLKKKKNPRVGLKETYARKEIRFSYLCP